MEILERSSLSRLRYPLPGSYAEPLLVQLPARRLRDLSRVRPCHQYRLRFGRARCFENFARGRDQAVAVLWRLGSKHDADGVLAPGQRFRPRDVEFGDEVLTRLPGLTVHDLMLLPVDAVRGFFLELHLPAPLDEATDLLLAEIRARL